MARLAELLAEVRNDTVENVERKQARTDQEREESEGEMSEEEQEDDEDDDIPYNPKVRTDGLINRLILYLIDRLSLTDPDSLNLGRM